MTTRKAKATADPYGMTTVKATADPYGMTTRKATATAKAKAVAKTKTGGVPVFSFEADLGG
jgi:hypothetical protein